MQIYREKSTQKLFKVIDRQVYMKSTLFEGKTYVLFKDSRGTKYIAPLDEFLKDYTITNHEKLSHPSDRS